MDDDDDVVRSQQVELSPGSPLDVQDDDDGSDDDEDNPFAEHDGRTSAYAGSMSWKKEEEGKT